MARFDRQIAVALRLIAKNGEPITWRTQPEPVVDPATPWNPQPSVPVDNTATICFLPVERVGMESFSHMLRTEVPKGLVLGYMGQVPFEPNIKDTVIRHGKELRVMNLDVLSPNGQMILYTVIFQA